MRSSLCSWIHKIIGRWSIVLGIGGKSICLWNGFGGGGFVGVACSVSLMVGVGVVVDVIVVDDYYDDVIDDYYDDHHHVYS